MDERNDNFSWARRLGFPPSGCTDSNLLNKGIIGLLWDDSSKLLHHPKHVLEVRKNILLYKLRNNLEDPRITHVKNIDRLKTERINLNDRIKVLEENYNVQEAATIKKENNLRLIIHDKEAPELKKELLKMKTKQIQETLKDSETMLNICSHLMPGDNRDVSQKEVRECLGLMGNVRSGIDKKQIIKKISQILGSSHIPTLWSILLECQSHDMDALIKLGQREISEFKNTVGEDIDIGLAKACGEHIKLVSMQLLEIAKTSENEKILMNYIEKIEMTEPDVNEWLEFALEVRMLEVEQNELQKEADQILNSISEQDSSESKLAELSSRLETLTLEKEKLIDDVQKSLAYLKGIRYLITETREKQLVNLQTIGILRSDVQGANSYQWKNVDLSVELEIFHKDLDVEAFRQISVKKDVIEQRYFKNSFNQGWIHLLKKLSCKLPNQFTMMKIPFLFLMECYKALYANALLKRVENLEPLEWKNCCRRWDDSRLENVTKSTKDLLHQIDSICKGTKEHMKEFEHLYDIWSHQTVQSAFAVLEEATVHGATLKEWQQRYSVIFYMLKKSSSVSLSFQPYSFDNR